MIEDAGTVIEARGQRVTSVCMHEDAHGGRLWEEAPGSPAARHRGVLRGPGRGHTFQFDAGVLDDADAGAHQAQRAAGAGVAARNELALADVVEVDDRKVNDRCEVGELLQHLHARLPSAVSPTLPAAATPAQQARRIAPEPHCRRATALLPQARPSRSECS